MITIITPCCRQENISKLFDSISFDKIHKWIIVYDTSKDRNYKKMYEDHQQILEVECNDVGVVGHPQRNFGMQLVEDGFIYFLDDDNIIHPNFWSIIEVLKDDKFYTFDQLRDNQNKILYGNNIQVGHIDTAMFIFHKNHSKDIYWENNKYAADGYFISDILNKNSNSHVYINNICCYYNRLSF